ncbi:MAG: DUF3035 domain-containing protein [Micavibrio sp.]|nr:DUF3035 domain-containing protein [Micavibrio sp.]
MTTHRQKITVLLAAALLVSVAGCSSVKKEFGVGRQSPDEFMVVKRAPLTLPPDYDLRPPSADSAPPASEAANQAKTAMLGAQGAEATKGSAENELLTKMGAQSASADIRSTIDRENGIISLQNRTLVDKLIFWSDDPNDDSKVPSSVVNAKAEADRIKKDQAAGAPVSGTGVPVIEKKQSTIEKLF